MQRVPALAGTQSTCQNWAPACAGARQRLRKGVDFCLSGSDRKAAKADIRCAGLSVSSRPNPPFSSRPDHTAEKSSSAAFRRCMSARDNTSWRSSFSRAARRRPSSFCSLINPLVDASHAAAAEFVSFPVAFIICSNLSCSAFLRLTLNCSANQAMLPPKSEQVCRSGSRHVKRCHPETGQQTVARR